MALTPSTIGSVMNYFDPYFGGATESMFAGLWRGIIWLYQRAYPTAEQCLDRIERIVGQLESLPVELRTSDELRGRIRYQFRQIGKFDARYFQLCFKLFWQPEATSLPGVGRYGELCRRVESLGQSFGMVDA